MSGAHEKSPCAFPDMGNSAQGLTFYQFYGSMHLFSFYTSKPLKDFIYESNRAALDSINDPHK